MNLCVGNPVVTGGFLAQRVSNVEISGIFNVSLNKLLNKKIELSVIWGTVARDVTVMHAINSHDQLMHIYAGVTIVTQENRVNVLR